MSPVVEFCTAREVPQEYAGFAREHAIAENPANNVTLPGGMEAAGEFRKFWKPGRTLTVAFLGGDTAVQKRIKAKARTWQQFANIRLRFVNGSNAAIRIALDDEDGHWSAVGTDALVTQFFPANEPTMNVALTTASPDSEYSRVVLHEFGHALGLIHEHQNPAAGIRWNERVVIDALMASQGWDEATIRHNVLNAVKRQDVRFTAFDDKSIMLYAFPAAWTVDGRQFGSNTTLSETDKAFIAAQYPR